MKEPKSDHRVGDVVAYNIGTEYEALGLVIELSEHGNPIVVFLTHFAPDAHTIGGIVHPLRGDVTLYQRGSVLFRNE